MVVIVIDNGSLKLRGELTRWLFEAKCGTFVGNVNAMVRDKLWNKVCDDTERKGAIIFYNSNSEQGFSMEMCGEPNRQVVNIEGIQLVALVD